MAATFERGNIVSTAGGSIALQVQLLDDNNKIVGYSNIYNITNRLSDSKTPQPNN